MEAHIAYNSRFFRLLENLLLGTCSQQVYVCSDDALVCRLVQLLVKQKKNERRLNFTSLNPRYIDSGGSMQVLRKCGFEFINFMYFHHAMPTIVVSKLTKLPMTITTYSSLTHKRACMLIMICDRKGGTLRKKLILSQLFHMKVLFFSSVQIYSKLRLDPPLTIHA